MHSIDICLDSPLPLYLDRGLPPRMNVKSSALSKSLDAGLKAYDDAGAIRAALNDVQTTLQISQRHRTLFVGRCVVLV